MSHFSETFRVKIDAENCTVKLSVRSSDERVDEHIIDVRDFNAATQEVSMGWGGSDAIKTKRAGHNVFISVQESDQKRIIYQVPHQNWRLLCEQFINAVRESGIEIAPYIVKDQPSVPEIPIVDIVNAIQQMIMPSMEAKFSTLQEQIQGITSNSNFIQVTAVHDTSSSSNTPVFIPTNIINPNIEGSAEVDSDVSSSSSLDDALAALKKLKGDSQ